MGMFHSTSGKWGYTYYQHPTNFKISKQQAILLLKEEQRLRREESTQEAYTIADTNFKELERITYNLQEQALTTIFGLKEGDLMWKDALIAFRNLRVIYKDDPEINQLTDYFKYDMSRNLYNDQVDLESIKIVDLLDYYDFDKQVHDFDQLNSSTASITTEELVAQKTKTLGQFLRERNTNNLPVAIIGSSYS